MRLRKKQEIKGMVSHTYHPVPEMMKHEDDEFPDSLSYFCCLLVKLLVCLLLRQDLTI